MTKCICNLLLDVICKKLVQQIREINKTLIFLLEGKEVTVTRVLCSVYEKNIFCSSYTALTVVLCMVDVKEI